MSESLAKIVYRKLKHLHQVQWDTYSTYSKAPGSDTGVWHTIVIVPCFDVIKQFLINDLLITEDDMLKFKSDVPVKRDFIVR